MLLEECVTIEGRPEAVWSTITDIEHAADTISAIEEVEILAQPETGLVGLKWRETRTMFGKTATEVIWVTTAEEMKSYETRAESHGAIYVSSLHVEGRDGQTDLAMRFRAQPQTLGAKIMWLVMGPMFRKATRNALQQDLRDIKNAVESASV